MSDNLLGKTVRDSLTNFRGVVTADARLGSRKKACFGRAWGAY